MVLINGDWGCPQIPRPPPAGASLFPCQYPQSTVKRVIGGRFFVVTEGDRALVQISPSALDVDDLIATFDDSIEFRDRLREAAVLIIPTDLRPEYEGPVFPIGTSEVFRYLSDNMDNHAIVEAAILDEDYIEFEHRSETLILPVIFIAKDVLLPLVVNLLGSFIHERLTTRRVQESESTVKSKVHYERADGEKFLMDYEGPADTFEKIVLQEIKDSGPNKGGPSPKT